MRKALAVFCLAATLFAGTIAPAAPEYMLKAKILLVLLPYVKWNSQDTWGDRPFQIAVLGESPFGTHLDEAAQHLTVHRRAVRIRYITKVSDAEGSQVLFICPSEIFRIDSILSWARGKPILTVADDEAADDRGIMINLMLEDRFVRLAINPTSANEAGIYPGAQLLRTARLLSTR